MTNVTKEYAPVTPDINVLLETQYRVYDGLLAAGFCLCFLVGFPGNCLSLIYFIRTKKRSLPTLLYITACCIDIVSCVIHLPVAVNLLNKRNPGLLGNKVFCLVWHAIFVYVQLMSMFVVMMLSVTRTIVILFPFYKIRKRSVFTSIAAAFLFVVVGNTTDIYSGEYFYSKGLSYCVFHGQTFIQHVYRTVYSVWTGITPVMVFSAMLTASLKLRTRNNMSNGRKKHRNAVMTMIYFAVVFLVCNILTFLNLALYNYAEITKDTSVYSYDNKFLFFYSWTLSDIFCTVLNGSLNPILYVFRFKEMRVWLTNATY